MTTHVFPIWQTYLFFLIYISNFETVHMYDYKKY